MFTAPAGWVQNRVICVQDAGRLMRIGSLGVGAEWGNEPFEGRRRGECGPAVANARKLPVPFGAASVRLPVGQQVPTVLVWGVPLRIESTAAVAWADSGDDAVVTGGADVLQHLGR
jgi:hypothetical protein